MKIVTIKNKQRNSKGKLANHFVLSNILGENLKNQKV